MHAARATLSIAACVLLAIAAGVGVADGATPTREDERATQLKPYFQPAPGSVVEVDPIERRDAPRGSSPLRLRGYITVAPPKGRCIVLTRLESQADDTICTRTVLSFKVEDLDKLGRLTWRAKLQGGDDAIESAPLTWKTPYRVAVVRKFDAKETDPPTYEVISGCTAKVARPLGRQVHLQLLGGRTWVVRLPDKDQLVPQPPPVPNLVITKSGGKVSVKDAAEAKRVETDGAPAKEAEAKADAHGDKPAAHGEKAEAHAPAADHGGAGAAPTKEEEEEADRMDISQTRDRETWGIPARGSYGMGSDHFIPYGTVTPGLNGECRYTFQGPPDDEATGRIECHKTDGYQHVFIPVPCFAELRGR